MITEKRECPICANMLKVPNSETIAAIEEVETMIKDPSLGKSCSSFQELLDDLESDDDSDIDYSDIPEQTDLSGKIIRVDGRRILIKCDEEILLKCVEQIESITNRHMKHYKVLSFDSWLNKFLGEHEQKPFED